MEPSIYSLRLRDLLAFCVLSLLLLGVIMVQSAATSVNGDTGWQWNARGSKHLVYALCAVVAFFVVGNIDYRWLARRFTSMWKNPIVWMFGAACFTCIIVLIPHIGMEVNGARRWLPLGFVQLQPSELAKWAAVLFLCYYLTQKADEIQDFFRGFLVMLIPIGFLCLLVVIQDFGTAALIGGCALTMLLAGRTKWWHLAIVIPPAGLAAFWFVHHEAYRWTRMTSFLNPWADPQGEGYHMIQSLLSFSTGGIFGKGLGNGIQKLGYLPEDTTDFIFAVICEEMGLFGALLTVALYVGILYIAWQIIRGTKEPFGRLMTFGIASMVALQATINVAVATVSVPTKGLSLPLVSAGGSGLVITCAALGLMYSVAKYGCVEEDEESSTRSCEDAKVENPETDLVVPI